MKLTAEQRRKLWAKYGGRCAYCGCSLPEKGWHADHLEPIYREWWKKKEITRYSVVDGEIVKTKEKQQPGMLRPENDREDNMMPSCRACNLDKAAELLEDWRTSLNFRIEVLRRNSSAFRHCERFGRFVVNTEPVVFYFERFEADADENPGPKEQIDQPATPENLRDHAG